MQSATRQGLDNLKETGVEVKSSLFKYFKKCTPEEYAAQLRREQEVHDLSREQMLHNAKVAKLKEKVRERDSARLRKQKSRAAKKEREIQAGIRDTSGRKKDIKPLELHDDGDLMKQNIAEESRPGRAFKEKAKKRAQEGTSKPRTSKPKKDAVYVNWFTPFLWSQILQAARDVGWQMRAQAIVDLLNQRNPVSFASLNRSTVYDWIDRSGPAPRWKEQVLERAARGNDPGHSRGGRRGALAHHPDVVEEIKRQLQLLRESKTAVTVITARAVILATIIDKRPEILDQKFGDGSTFKASESYVRVWLHDALRWSRRKATRAARKVPQDWEDQCELAFFRIAYAIKEYDVPSSLFVNSDQTQLLYAPGDKMTWTDTNSKQVELVGAEEKRAFTVMVSVANDGTALPFQAIYQGLSTKSCPSSKAPKYDECEAAGFLFQYSNTSTYWSNQARMEDFVERVLVKYFNKVKEREGRPADQRCIWQIDVWSVHRSAKFREWMRKTYPWIIVVYVPGGCTGRFQPCDVGIQRPFKLSTKKSYHEDVVREFLAKKGESVVVLNTNLAAVRDRSVRWLWNAWNAVNNKELVKKVGTNIPNSMIGLLISLKAFTGCEVRGWNLGWESVGNHVAFAKLREMKEKDPERYKLIQVGKAPPASDEAQVEDEERVDDDDFDDDCDVPMKQAISAMATGKTQGKDITFDEAGNIRTVAAAETTEGEEEMAAQNAMPQPEEGRGKRAKRPNPRYGASFIRHWDEDDPEKDDYQNKDSG
jgi:hypothetical protein